MVLITLLFIWYIFHLFHLQKILRGEMVEENYHERLSASSEGKKNISPIFTAVLGYTFE